MKIAVTGNRAAGKDTFCNGINDFEVVDENKIIDDILSEREAKDDLRLALGESVISNGAVNRYVLQRLLGFSANVSKFNSFLHPRLKGRVNEIFNDVAPDQILIYKSRRLFELKLNQYFDKILFISAGASQRKNRLVHKYGYTSEMLDSILRLEMPESYKIRRSDYIIYNNTDVSTFYSQVNDHIQTLLFDSD